MVNPIDPVLHLQHNTPVPRDNAREVRLVEEALALLERQAAVLLRAAVQLEGVLVGVDVELDAGPGGGDAGYVA